jgi:hypothetical protein
MTNTLKSWVPSFIAFLFILLFWKQAMTIQNESILYNVSGIALLIIALSYYRPVRVYFSNDQVYLVLLRSMAILTLCFLSWNSFFRNYSDNSDFKGNIFRGAFYDFQSPTYFHFAHDPKITAVQLIAAVIFLIYIWGQKERLGEKIPDWKIIGIAVIVIFGYTYHNTISETFLSVNCHYATYAEDLNKYSGWRDLLHNYVSKMGSMSVHNNHYPPLTLLILKIGEDYFPYLLKVLVILSTVISIFGIRKIMSLFNCDELSKNLAGLLLLCTPAILYFPEIATDPITLPFALFSFYYLLRSVKEKSAQYAILFALIFTVYLFITFSSIFFLAFACLYVLVLIWKKEAGFLPAIKTAAISVAGIISLVAAIQVLTGFSLKDCFIEGLAIEKRQMNSEAIVNVPRYLIISTGNILAYLLILGIPVIGIYTYGIFRAKQLFYGNLFYLLFVIPVTLLCYGFSGHFFLETERIWIFLSPFVFIICGVALADLYKKDRKHILTLLTSAAILTLLLKARLSQCF